mgnify:CR=1 FL=1
MAGIDFDSGDNELALATAERCLEIDDESFRCLAVALNAAAALVIAGKAADLKEGAALAAESIDSGAAKKAVETLAKITQDTPLGD